MPALAHGSAGAALRQPVLARRVQAIIVRVRVCHRSIDVRRQVVLPTRQSTESAVCRRQSESLTDGDRLLGHFKDISRHSTDTRWPLMAGLAARTRLPCQRSLCQLSVESAIASVNVLNDSKPSAASSAYR